MRKMGAIFTSVEPLQKWWMQNGDCNPQERSYKKKKSPDFVAEVQICFGAVVVALQSNTQGVSTEENFSLQGSFKDADRVPIKTENSS